MKILDVSNNKILNCENIKHFHQEICNLYRPCWNNVCEQDSYNIVYSWDSNINETKFYPLLIKEWFYLVEKNGYLIIEYTPNNILTPLDIEDELWTQWKWKYEILEHRVQNSLINEQNIVNYIKNIENDYYSEEDIWFDDFNNNSLLNKKWVITIKKNESTLIEWDSINRWTIWIITNWKRNDWIEELITSVKNQNIPEYEIIVCWSYNIKREENNFKYIPFNKRNNLGWITKKKNLIIQNSKYENICILHDRYIFDKNWFEGMKKWWNNFEHLTCNQKFIENEIEDKISCISSLEIQNPEVLNFNYLKFNKLFHTNLLSMKDFSKNIYIWWGVHIFKKKFSGQIMYNENIFWRECEDVIISLNFNKEWLYSRENHYSTLMSRTHIKIPKKIKKIYSNKEYDNRWAGKLKKNSIISYYMITFYELSWKYEIVDKLYFLLRGIYQKLNRK